MGHGTNNQNSSTKTIQIQQPLRKSGSTNQQLAVTRSKKSRCITKVPAAPTKIIGNCVYYYKPYGSDDVVNKTGVNFKAVFEWATTIPSYSIEDTKHLFRKLIKNEDTLIPANSSDPNWSRWHNFFARHVGCKHTAPSYYISYGYYYCSNFGAYLLPRLKSSQGKNWLNQGRVLLQKYMEKGLLLNNTQSAIKIPSARHPNKRLPGMWVGVQKLELQDEIFKTFAYNSHVPAYLDAGIVDVPIADLMRVFGQPNVEEWIDLETWNQAMLVALEVVPKKLDNPLDTSKEVVDAVWQAGTDIFDRNASRIKDSAGYVRETAGGVWEWVQKKF